MKFEQLKIGETVLGILRFDSRFDWEIVRLDAINFQFIDIPNGVIQNGLTNLEDIKKNYKIIDWFEEKKNSCNCREYYEMFGLKNPCGEK